MITSYKFIPCIECGAKACWSYMPGMENYCDKHVPRGCSCNSKLKDGIDYDSPEAENPDNYIEELDEQGRRYPCCEYSEIFEECHADEEYVKAILDSYAEQVIPPDWMMNE
jgi:hypothetical protein